MAYFAIGFAQGMAFVFLFTVVWALAEKRVGTLLAGVVTLTLYSVVMWLGVQIIVATIAGGGGTFSVWPISVGFAGGIGACAAVRKLVARRTRRTGSA